MHWIHGFICNLLLRIHVSGVALQTGMAAHSGVVFATIVGALAGNCIAELIRFLIGQLIRFVAMPVSPFCLLCHVHSWLTV